MNKAYLKFGVFCGIWLALLFHVFPGADKWDIKSGELSSSASAVHPLTGVSAHTPLLRVEETASPAGKNYTSHGVLGFMPVDVKLDGYPLAHAGDRRFVHHLVYGGLEEQCVPLELTPDRVSLQPGWGVQSMERNKLSLLAPDGSLLCYEYFTLPQNTEVFYSGEVKEGKLTVFVYKTERYNTAYALEARKESLETMYRIYRDGDVAFFTLLRRLLLLMVFLVGLVFCVHLWPFTGKYPRRGAACQ